MRAQWGAYLFGHTAPDFVSRTHRRREESHFFNVPMTDRRPAHLRLLEVHRGLLPDALPDPEAACFVAGYLCHLWVDQLWISNIFEPFFGIQVNRATFRERLLDHNLLRAHMDIQDEANLSPETLAHLVDAQPSEWLPFATAKELNAWLHHLTDQLAPSGQSRTIEVFSQKSGVSAGQFLERLNSPQSMRARVFQHIPEGIVDGFRGLAVDACRELTFWYLGGANSSGSPVNEPFRVDMIRQADIGTRAHHAVD